MENLTRGKDLVARAMDRLDGARITLGATWVAHLGEMPNVHVHSSKPTTFGTDLIYLVSGPGTISGTATHYYKA